MLLGVGVGGRRLDVAGVEGQHQLGPVERDLQRLLPAAAVDYGERVDGEQLDVNAGRGQVDDAVAQLEVAAGEAVAAEHLHLHLLLVL